MSALVTGSTGLLGGSIVRALRERGEDVMALARSEQAAAEMLPSSGVRVLHGDLAELLATPEWLAGVDTIYHCAAYFREYYAPGDHDAALRKINVEMVGELLKAAHRAGVETVVHTSTIGIVGDTLDGSLSDENAKPGARSLRNGYHRSKWESEQLVHELAPSLDLKVPIIRPGWLFGPADRAPTASGQLVRDVCDGKLPAVPPGGNHCTDARDVAAACIAGADMGASERAYIFAAPWQPMREVIETIARAADRSAPRLSLPTPLAHALAFLSELQARLTGGVPLATRHGIEALTESRRVTSARAEQELGARFREFSATIADEVGWLHDHGVASV